MELAEALNIPWDPAVIFHDIDPPARLPSQEPSSDSEDGLIIGPLHPIRLDRRLTTSNGQGNETYDTYFFTFKLMQVKYKERTGKHY